MSESTCFSDVDIRVGHPLETGRYPVSIETAAGDASDLMELYPADDAFQQDLQAIENGETDEDFFIAFGQHLFDALLPGKVRGCFRTAAGLLSQGQRLRLRLRLRPPELSALPWEFLYDPELEIFLGIDSRILLSRYVVDAPEFVKPMAVSPPLRLLVAFSNPMGVMPLDLDREKEVLIQATRGAVDAGRMEISFLDHITHARLRSTLRDVQPHIFHFVGHGEFDGEKGYLIFEDDHGKARRMSDRKLWTFFRDAQGMKLAVLNACHGATTSTGQAISGVAPYLVAKGMPAVIAMRYPVPDDTAITFSREFYEALTHETPAAVDVAVAAGRRAIYQDMDSDQPDWGIPNVFLRARDGTIFAPPEVAAEAENAKPSGGVSFQDLNISNVSGSTINISDIAGGDISKGNG